MKKIIPFFVVIFLSSLPCSALALEKNKVGVIDMQKFQQESKKFQKIRADLKKKFEALQKKLDKEKAGLAKLEEEFKKQSMMLSLDAKQDKKKEVERKRRYYKYLYTEYTQEMKDAELDARKKVGKEVEKIVGKMGETGGYVMIFERQAPGLIYYDDALDITEKVVKAYDGASQ
ncbi:MAG: OmpH family outer membrane protein [Deltaproteobacteria bacterium]|nr:OmpH family outer membrane protein [Deltaproteobacteria bacterium]